MSFKGLRAQGNLRDPPCGEHQLLPSVPTEMKVHISRLLKHKSFQIQEKNIVFFIKNLINVDALKASYI